MSSIVSKAFQSKLAVQAAKRGHLTERESGPVHRRRSHHNISVYQKESAQPEKQRSVLRKERNRFIQSR